MTKPKKVKPVTYKAWGLCLEGGALYGWSDGEVITYPAREDARQAVRARKSYDMPPARVVRLTVTVKVEA